MTIDVAALIARYRAAEAEHCADLRGGATHGSICDGCSPLGLDPTRVWTVDEFRAVMAAAERAPRMLELRRESTPLACPGCAADGREFCRCSRDITQWTARVRALLAEIDGKE